MMKYRSKETRNQGRPNKWTKRQITRKSDNNGGGGGGGEGGDDISVILCPLVFFFVNITLNYEMQVKW